jgi:hypothetical protein
LEAGSEEDRIMAGHALAFQKKKLKQFNEALEIWKEVALKGNVQIRIQAQIECAKLYEHQFKEVGHALKCSIIAHQEMVREGITQEKKQLELEKRIRRLEKKEGSKDISV